MLSSYISSISLFMGATPHSAKTSQTHTHQVRPSLMIGCLRHPLIRYTHTHEYTWTNISSNQCLMTLTHTLTHTLIPTIGPQADPSFGSPTSHTTTLTSLSSHTHRPSLRPAHIPPPPQRTTPTPRLHTQPNERHPSQIDVPRKPPVMLNGAYSNSCSLSIVW